MEPVSRQQSSHVGCDAVKPSVIFSAVACTLAGAALAGCGVISAAAGGQTADSAPSLSSSCVPANRQADVPGDAAYDLTLTNSGSQAVQVTQVAVIFYGASGQQVASDDPAQQDFPGDQEPIGSFNAVLVGAGQSVTIPMETGKVGGAAGNWTCQLGSWSNS